MFFPEVALYAANVVLPRISLPWPGIGELWVMGLGGVTRLDFSQWGFSLEYMYHPTAILTSGT